MTKNKTQFFSMEKVEAICLFCVLAAACAVFMYEDMTNTVDNSIILLRAVTHGRLSDFYELSVQQAQTSFSANYNLILYLIFAVWLLPVYAVSKLLGIPYIEWPFGLFWAKLLVVFVTVGIAWLLCVIVKECHPDEPNKDRVPVVFLSSFAVFYAVFVAAQIDCFALLFMLLGLREYLRGNRKRFYLWFWLSVPCKMFSLLLALPLILWRQKNLLKAGGGVLFLLSPLAAEQLLFRNSPVHKYALAAQGKDALKQIMDSNLAIAKPIIVFLAVYIAVLCYCYMSEEVENNRVIYVCSLLWGIFVSFLFINTYWIFLMAPFMVLNLFVNSRYLGMGVALETVCSGAYMLTVIASNNWILRDGSLMTRLFLPLFFRFPDRERARYGDVIEMFNTWGFSEYKPVVSTVFIVCMLLLLVLTFPGKNEPRGFRDHILKDGRIPHGLISLRILALALFAGVVVYGAAASTNPVYYSNFKADGRIAYHNLTSRTEQNVFSQKITFDGERKLRQLQLKFRNTHVARSNASMVAIEIWNLQEQKMLFQKKVLGCAVEDEGRLVLDLKKIPVSPGAVYEIRLWGTGGIAENERKEAICPFVTEERDESLPPLEIQGVEQACTLMFELR